jgi:hypothetical protein
MLSLSCISPSTIDALSKLFVLSMVFPASDVSSNAGTTSARRWIATPPSSRNSWASFAHCNGIGKGRSRGSVKCEKRRSESIE